MELEKIGVRSILGTYIVEGNLAYIEQEEEGKVTVATMEGIRETVPISELDKFISAHDMDDDVREELKILISNILKK
jgi:tellurite resistance-related uncharacterized protein